MHTKKNIAQKFVPAKYTLKLGFAQVTHFPIFSRIHGVWPPYLGAGIEFIRPNFWHVNLRHWASKKLMPRWFSASWKHNPNIWGCARSSKIGLTSIFLMFNTQNRCTAHLHDQKLVRPQNMGAELPVLRICHAHPCLRKHPKFGVLCTTTGLAGKYVLLGVQRPYFGCNRVRGPSFIARLGLGSQIHRKQNI